MNIRIRAYGLFFRKRILVTSAASNHRIRHRIAAMHREGAELAFTYQNDKLKPC